MQSKTLTVQILSQSGYDHTWSLGTGETCSSGENSRSCALAIVGLMRMWEEPSHYACQMLARATDALNWIHAYGSLVESKPQRSGMCARNHASAL